MDAKICLEDVRRSEVRLAALMERQEKLRILEAAAGGEAGKAVKGLEQDIGRRIGEYTRAIAEIEGRIDALEDALQRDVLRYRYLNGWSWEEICRRTGYSPGWVHRKRREGLRAMLNQDSGQ